MCFVCQITVYVEFGKSTRLFYIKVFTKSIFRLILYYYYLPCQITMLDREHLQDILNYKESESRSKTILTEIKSENARLNEDLTEFEEQHRMLQLRDEELSSNIQLLYESKYIVQTLDG